MVGVDKTTGLHLLRKSELNSIYLSILNHLLCCDLLLYAKLGHFGKSQSTLVFLRSVPTVLECGLSSGKCWMWQIEAVLRYHDVICRVLARYSFAAAVMGLTSIMSLRLSDGASSFFPPLTFSIFSSSILKNSCWLSEEWMLLWGTTGAD